MIRQSEGLAREGFLLNSLSTKGRPFGWATIHLNSIGWRQIDTLFDDSAVYHWNEFWGAYHTLPILAF